MQLRALFFIFFYIFRVSQVFGLYHICILCCNCFVFTPDLSSRAFQVIKIHPLSLFLISRLVVSLKCEFLPGMLFLYCLLSEMFSLGIFPAGDIVGYCCGSKFAYQAISFHHCVCHELRTFLLDKPIRG